MAKRRRTDKNYYFEFEKWALSLINALPGNQSKKGADKGIDGNIYFAKTSRAIAPVPRLQIVSIEEALDLRDRAVRLPARRDDTFKKAAVEKDTRSQGKLDL